MSIDRVRKVDVEKLSKEEVDQLSSQIGDRMRQIVDKACEDANAILKVYGLQAKMQFQLEKTGAPDTEE